MLGGQWEDNGGSYGLPIIAVPSKRMPDAVDRITEFYLRETQKDERFHDVRRPRRQGADTRECSSR